MDKISGYADGDGKAVFKGGDAGKKKIDYRETVTPENFAVFAKLRDWRRETAFP